MLEQRAITAKVKLLGETALACEPQELHKWAIAGRSGHEAYARYLVLRSLNAILFENVLPCVAYETMVQAPHGRLLLSIKRLIFEEVRGAVAKPAGPASSSPFNLQIDRAKAEELREMQTCDSKGEFTQFAQASLAAISSEHFRRQGSSWTEQPFTVKYLHEEGVDQGGLYRSFLNCVSEELMSKHLPIFLPSANQVTDSGEHRECWVLSPALATNACSSGHRLLRFLGQLMGLCLLRGDVLTLSLSQAFWRGLTGDELGFEDLEAFDIAAARTVEAFRDPGASGIEREEFDAAFADQRFVTEDSAGRPISLVVGGEGRPVTFDNAPRFAELALEARLRESMDQLAVIREGIKEVVATESWALWTWRALEQRVVGVSEVDVSLLKKKVKYEGWTADSLAIIYFWAALESFSQKDLCNFLHFVWGRSRLPPEDSPLWGGGFKITRQAGDRNALPQAHTCFFQIDLPDYASLDIAKDRILFAVRNCVSVGIA